MTRTIVHDFDETITEPLRIPARTEYRNARIRLADNYVGGWQQPAGEDRRGDFGVVRIEAGSSGATIDGLVLDGPNAEWWIARVGQPWTWPTRGVTVVGAVGVTLARCRVSNLPAEGFYARDFMSLKLLDCEAERCNSALAVDWPRVSGNRNLTVDGLLAIDTWGIGDLNAIGSSILRPLGQVGATFAYGSGIVNGIFRRLRCIGEGKGVKFSQCAGLRFEAIRVPQLWLGGAGGTPAGWKGPLDARGYSLTRSVLGESTFGWSREKVSDPSTLHLWGGTADECLVTDTVILAPRPGPLFAPWWQQSGNDGQAPNFTRYQAVQASEGFKLRLGQGCRMVDLHGDHPEPTWVEANTGATVVEEPAVPRERFTPHWEAP